MAQENKVGQVDYGLNLIELPEALSFLEKLGVDKDKVKKDVGKSGIFGDEYDVYFTGLKTELRRDPENRLPYVLVKGSYVSQAKANRKEHGLWVPGDPTFHDLEYKVALQ